MAQEIIQENAYLYRVHYEKFECLNGTVFLFAGKGLYRFVRHEDQLYLDHYSIKGTKAMIAVSSIPGEVYNHTMWLPERDDEKARQIFHDYYAKEMRDLDLRISRLVDLIAITRGEL